MVKRALIVFVLLVAASGAIARAERTEQVPIRAPFNGFPLQMDEWHGVPDAPMDAQTLAVLGVDDYLTRTYYAANRAPVGLYIGYWESQRQGDTIHSPLNCLPGSGWEPLSKSTARIAVAPPAPGADPAIVVNRYVVQKGLDRMLVLYWYQSHGRVIASEYWSKFFLVTDAVRWNRTDAALVRVITPIGSGSDPASSAEQIAVHFVQTMFPQLSRFLPV
jgi:EpsI family protein